MSLQFSNNRYNLFIYICFHNGTYYLKTISDLININGNLIVLQYKLATGLFRCSFFPAIVSAKLDDCA